MTIERLTAVLPPPPSPVEAPGAHDWAVAEEALGLRLPTDYRAFVDAFGSGTVDGFIHVLNPAAAHAGGRLGSAVAEILGIQREIRQTSDSPFPIHPEPGGLLPWARTDNGNNLYWLTEPADDPDRWPILVDEARGPGWFRHEGPMTAFLADALTGAIRVSVFPDDFPSDRPRFTPRPPADPAATPPPVPRPPPRPEPPLPALPGDLVPHLEDLAAEHRRIGSPLLDDLGPGVPDAEVRRRVSELGLEPPAELVDLYAWKRGGVELVAGITWLTLDEGVQRFEAGRAQAEDLVRMSRGGIPADSWFPIAIGPSDIAIACPPGGGAASVRQADWERRVFGQIAPTPAAFVDELVARLRAGAYRWDASGHRLVADEAVLKGFRLLVP